MGPVLDDTARTRLRELGVDLARTLPAYPLEVWVQVMRYAASRVAPGLPESEQMEQLGRRFIDGYEQTLVGRALLASMRLIGPRRTLERMSRNFRTGNNYTEAKVTERGPTEVELWLSHVKAPEFYRGMLQAGLARTGPKSLDVRLVSHDANGATFRVAWNA